MKRCLTSLIAGLALFGVVAGHPSKASAFKYYQCTTLFWSGPLKWSNNSTQMRANKTSFAPGVWRDALTESVSKWNSNPSKFFFNLTVDDPDTEVGNGENEVWFTNDDNVLNGMPAKTAISWDIGCNVTEVDTVFDNRLPYTPFTNKSTLGAYGGSSRPFQTTASHELGHALLLDHENRFYNIMGEDFTHLHTNAGVAKTYPGEDASNGAVFLYGLFSTPLNDLSVSHWKLSGKTGGYSLHGRTQIFDTSEAVLSSYNDAGEPRYYVNRGQQVQVELTYENNGAEKKTVNFGHYISTNQDITTFDTLIRESSLTLGRDTPLTTRHIVTIPSSLAPGKYYIGAIVDKNNVVSEQDETNNSTYIAIEVK